MALTQLRDELLQPVTQRERLADRAITAPDHHHILDDFVNAFRVLDHDLGQPQIAGIQLGGFGEQLPRVTDGAQWIADLVRNAGRQAPERGEFDLLHSLLCFGRVFDEHQRVAGSRLTQLGKRHDHFAAVRELQRRFAVLAAQAPFEIGLAQSLVQGRTRFEHTGMSGE